jgi:hypothetical protein
MKENPIQLEEGIQRRPLALSRESVFTTAQRLASDPRESNLRKRRSSDMDDLSEELRDKCNFGDEF